ncbi:acyl-CoA dehydrogenase family protein [Variovorax ginsengisoli]|uniref:Acyl-CoA dehydrogenase n=1 Tax=Variovorax ginsengisoli TaxID=363844 RepID=A0ABT8SDT9_9BURK|nr:acyl-CoA dehydrogenase [Variovorax ginsengisoli]MDN8616441.1 acyl-CoA dehydrogenase [Variovorax ginsengisoli]MDO1535611.1 acyl-CoA dehydrogenase [Variovorax ginsengisoli]
MRLTLTDEQTLIQSSALDWLAGCYDFRQREASLHRDGGSPETWTAFAEMGWLGLPIPEEAGGLGMGPLETGLLMQAFGRHLVTEPWHACVLQAGRLLALVGTPEQRADLLPGLVAGESRLALAHMEPGDRLPWTSRQTKAAKTASGWRLQGEKRQVVGGAGASRWIVSAAAENGTRLFLVDPAAEGVRVDAYDTTTGGRAADIVFDGASAEECEPATSSADTVALLHEVIAEGILARAWEATGTMQAALAQTAAYTQQRRQFGQSLSQFQVIQHRLAEMAVQCTEAQAACELAAMRVALDGSSAIAMADFVKTKVGRAARFVGQEAVQLHGAMGVCEELPVAAMFRALLAFGQQDGDAPSHATWLGDLLLSDKDYVYSQTLREATAPSRTTATV